MIDREPLKPQKLTYKDILTNKYIYELRLNGIVDDDQIEAYIKEQLIIKGLIKEDE